MNTSTLLTILLGAVLFLHFNMLLISVLLFSAFFFSAIAIVIGGS